MKKFLLTILGFSLILPGTGVFANEVQQLPPEKDWKIVLENVDISALQKSEASVLVIPTSADGAGQKPFIREDIARLQQARKTVLAYFSVATVDINAPYWNPAWEMAPKSKVCYETYYRSKTRKFEVRRCDEDRKPNWVGPFNVKMNRFMTQYWSKEWWDAALAPQLKQITTLGFDGVYVEATGAVQFWAGQGKYKIPFLEKELLKIVKKIRHETKKIVTKNNDNYNF